jgi:basic amino acid/polyamine antiporter, APA family
MLERGRRKPGDISVHIERPIKLRRVLGTAGLYASAYGNVGSSIYYALAVVAMSALGLTPPVLILSGIFFLFTGLTYSEGSTMLPDAGGSGAFARRAFNDIISFITSWALMLDYLVTIAISSFSVANYLSHFYGPFGTYPLNSIIAIVIVVLLVFINIAGIRESTRLNIVMVIVDIITQLLIAIFGVIFLINIPTLIQNVHWGVAPTTTQLLFGISISMVAYTGIETVANLGGETRNPGRVIPRTVMLIFITVIVLYTLLSMTALSAYPVQIIDNQWVTNLTEKFMNDPILGISNALPETISSWLNFWVALLAVTILTIATNAGIIGASRLAYFMGVRQQLPLAIGSINRRSRVPLNALIVFSAIACLLILIGQISIMADLYAFGAMLAYTMAHLSIIALRIKEPKLQRPFKIPLNIHFKTREIPVTAILGGLATFGTWLIVLLTHEYGRIVGFSWLIIGLLIYLFYRRFTHKPLIESMEIKTQYKIHRDTDNPRQE